MSKIRLDYISIMNYRSFGEKQEFYFPEENLRKPIAITGYNNAGKTNLMNAILYGVGEKYINANTFKEKDLHKLESTNNIEIITKITASEYKIWSDYHQEYQQRSIGGDHKIKTEREDNEIKSSVKPSFFGASKHYRIFYINFHKIKEELSTKKTSWGNLTSFLAKHIDKIITQDLTMRRKNEEFKGSMKKAQESILKDSLLEHFIGKIKSNYQKNLRENNCIIEFGLPDYEDIFHQMIFKIGLNGNTDNLIPIDHFGDGYISMFVMAVIQAIADQNTKDKCLFLFEEPESFLHENHQEYFYKMVLCELAKKGHQVLYTTHSAKMIDVFNTESIIRIEFDDEKKQTVLKYNNCGKFSPVLPKIEEEQDKIITLKNYNNFIRSVEPNLNKIIFSRKVILVEGPNDLIAYTTAIKKKAYQVNNNVSFADSYMNFKNISIVVHYGKTTTHLLIELCKHFGLAYYVINDWDFDHDFRQSLLNIDKKQLQQLSLYKNSTRHEKGMITTNWLLLKNAGDKNIHFNIPKLESVLGYESNNKESYRIWSKVKEMDTIPTTFFPKNLSVFVELENPNEKELLSVEEDEDTLPF